MRERVKAMFNNELLSDVQFIVQKSYCSSGECRDCETACTSHDRAANRPREMSIPAHKFLLAISSPVFRDMFYGQKPESSATIEVHDSEYESLLEVLRYIYSDEVLLTGSNVMEVLILAESYKLPALVEKCVEYLGKGITATNVIGILKKAQEYQAKSVEAGCWEVIDKYTEQVVKSDEFVTVDSVLLEAIISRDSLTVSEVELFEAVNHWANKQCEIQVLVQDGNLKRRLLGERIVEKLRFPVMKQEEFASVVLDSNILTPKECFDIIKHFSSVLPSPLKFPMEKRLGWCRERLHRFCRVVDYGWCYSPGKQDSIILTVDKPIVLQGVSFCGNQNETYSLNLKITDLSSSSAVGTLNKCFSSQKLPYKSSHYWGFEALFDLPVVLEKGIRYSVDAVISGLFSWRGLDGMSSIQGSGVSFNFENSDQSSNGTSVIKGQFPEFLFCVK